MQKIFEDIIKAIHNAGGCDGSCDYDKGWDDAISSAISEVETVIAEYDNGWITVSERLPEEYRNDYRELIPFLVCEDESDFPFRAFYDGKGWGDGIYKLDVVAWQTLPEPYKKTN